MNDYSDILKNGKSRLKESRLFYAKLKSDKPRDLDVTVESFHDQVFEKIDCLKCANCCKSISPVFKDADISRISKHLKLKPSELTKNYLHLDNENDYVLNNSPCAFLANDNYCRIYEVRPVACREYPHTNRKRFYQVIDKTIKSLQVCPAVVEVTEKLKEYYIHLKMGG